MSFLQRLTEDFEYSGCLDNAASAADQYEQLAYVAGFTVSSYANTTVRTGKPFNPLLGETFECDRMSDLGWRAFTEQVYVIFAWLLRTILLLFISLVYYHFVLEAHNIIYKYIQ